MYVVSITNSRGRCNIQGALLFFACILPINKALDTSTSLVVSLFLGHTGRIILELAIN